MDLTKFNNTRDNVKMNSALPTDEVMPTEEQMAKDLKQKFKTVESKKKSIEEKQAINAPMIENQKMELIKSLFDHMKGVGIDPSDPNQINKFLQTLEKNDPDLLELFEFAFSGLMSAGSQGMPSEEAPMEPEGLGASLTQPMQGQVGLPPMPTGQGMQPPMPAQPLSPQPSQETGGLMDKFKNLAGGVFRK